MFRPLLGVIFRACYFARCIMLQRPEKHWYRPKGMQAPRDVTTTQAAGSLEAGLVGTL
jgi:hypothetical protein